MKPFFFLLFISLVLTGCSTDKQAATEQPEVKPLSKDSSIVYRYIYDSESGSQLPVDSLKLIESNHESVLEFYKDQDSVVKMVDGYIYFSILKLKEEKFAVIIDSTARVYQFNEGRFNRIHLLNYQLGLPAVELEYVDVNQDGNKDVLFFIPSGGTFGDHYLCLFYNPDSRTLVHDDNVSLRNMELYPKEHKVITRTKYSFAEFVIEKYSFRIVKETRYLCFEGKDELQDKIRVTLFDKEGRVSRIDTLNE